MKKVLSVISLVVLISVLAGVFSSCSNKDSSGESSSKPESSSQETSQTSNVNGYDYSKPVPKAEEWVKKDYFNDAVFVGDSVSTGISIYEFMENSTVYADKGISPNNIFTKECVTTDSGKTTIMNAVSQKKFAKIYILLGANAAEFMTTEDFKSKYGTVIDEFKKSNPDAKIYIQSVFPITKELSDKNIEKDVKLNNNTIKDYNKALQELANEKQVYFVNVYEGLANESGELPTEYSSDGIHIKATQYQLWFDYLRTHTVK